MDWAGRAEAAASQWSGLKPATADAYPERLDVVFDGVGFLLAGRELREGGVGGVGVERGDLERAHVDRPVEGRLLLGGSHFNLI